MQSEAKIIKHFPRSADGVYAPRPPARPPWDCQSVRAQLRFFIFVVGGPCSFSCCFYISHAPPPSLSLSLSLCVCVCLSLSLSLSLCLISQVSGLFERREHRIATMSSKNTGSPPTARRRQDDSHSSARKRKRDDMTAEESSSTTGTTTTSTTSTAPALHSREWWRQFRGRCQRGRSRRRGRTRQTARLSTSNTFAPRARPADGGESSGGGSTEADAIERAGRKAYLEAYDAGMKASIVASDAAEDASCASIRAHNSFSKAREMQDVKELNDSIDKFF